MFQVLRLSESCLQKGSQSLHDGNPVDLSTQTRMVVFGFVDVICSCLCIYSLFKSLRDFKALADSIIASCFLSLAVFLFVSAMKHIGFTFQFFKIWDIENGALGLLTMFSVIIRYITVAPVWISFLDDKSLKEYPSKQLNGWCFTYIFTKLIGFWLLCVDFSDACQCFYKSLMLRAPPNTICQKCKKNEAKLSTQCSHYFCRNCINRARKANGECPICKFKIPRKWTMPFKFGSISMIVLFCIF